MNEQQPKTTSRAAKWALAAVAAVLLAAAAPTTYVTVNRTTRAVTNPDVGITFSIPVTNSAGLNVGTSLTVTNDASGHGSAFGSSGHSLFGSVRLGTNGTEYLRVWHEAGTGYTWLSNTLNGASIGIGDDIVINPEAALIARDMLVNNQFVFGSNNVGILTFEQDNATGEYWASITNQTTGASVEFDGDGNIVFHGPASFQDGVAGPGGGLTDINGNQVNNPEALITMTEGGTLTINSETNHYRVTVPTGVTNWSINLPASPEGQRSVFVDMDNTSDVNQITTIKVNDVATSLQWENRGTLAQTITNSANSFIRPRFTSGGGNWQSFTAPYILEVTDEDLLELAADGSTGSGPFVRQSGATMINLTLDQLVVDEFTLPLLSEDPDPPGTGFLKFFARDSDKLPYVIDETGAVSSMAGGSGTGTTNASGIFVTNTPAAYTPDDTFVEGHLKGIDDALAALGAWSPLVTDTTSTSATPLHTNAVAADVTRYSQARIIATQQTNSAAFYVSAVANNTGGSLVIVTNTLERLTNSVTASWDAFFSASGANLVLNALGPAEGVSWKVVQLNTWTHTNYLGASSPYLWQDFFEDASINTTTWPEIVGSAITASTTDPIDGTRSLLLADPSSGAEYITSLDIGENHETIWFGFLINISTPNAGGRAIIRIQNSANDAELALVSVGTSRTYQVQATGGSTSSASTDTIPNTAGQSIPMMIRYDRGTGANATITVYTSTDDTTWTQSRQSANGTSTEYARRTRFINNASWNMGIRIDRAVAKTSEMTPDEILNGL